MPPQQSITVCICTYKRPEFLKRLLECIDKQSLIKEYSVSIVVADNDIKKSAETTVLEHAMVSPLDIVYCHESKQNIALARNRAIENAKGYWVAFIDDDEFPTEQWLENMVKTCINYDCAGVLGPVRPHFESPPPRWIIKGRFCDRPELATGTVMNWGECRTGNLLFRREILTTLEETPFLAQFGTGGEDKDFFMRLSHKGHRFVWCSEGAVLESVPPERWTRKYMLNRALLRGRNILKHPEGRIKAIGSSLVATPIYMLLIPFTLLGGQHHFMKYCIKFCDHFGRLLAIVGLNRISQRQN